jgi:CHASE3 domain sensor protein
MDASKISPSQRKLQPDLSVRWRGALIISIPIICLFASILAIAVLRSKTIESRNQERHSRQTLIETERLLRMLVDAETGVRGYALTRRPEFIEPYSQAKSLLPKSLDSVSARVQANPAQRQQFQKILTLAQQQITLLEQILKRSEVAGATTRERPH